MGAWGVTALENDSALDELIWISSVSMKHLPYITELLLLADNEDYKMLGVVIVACTKMRLSPKHTLKEDNEFLNKVYSECQINETFLNQMWLCTLVYVKEAIEDLKKEAENWRLDAISERESYLEILDAICGAGVWR